MHKTIKLSLAIVLLILTGNNYAQSNLEYYFEKTYGNPGTNESTANACNPVYLPDGSAVVLARTYLSGNADKTVIYRIDKYGDIISQGQFEMNPGYTTFVPSTIELAYDGNLLIGGHMHQSNFWNQQWCILKVDLNYNIIWERFYGQPYRGNRNKDIIRLNDGNYLGFGDSHGLGANLEKRNAFLKFDDAGNAIWSMSLGNSGDRFHIGQALEHSNGNVYMFGCVEDNNASNPNLSREISVICIDPVGQNVIWAEKIGLSGNNKEFAISACELSNGNMVMCGYTQSSCGAGGNDICFIKIDENGAVLVSEVIGTPGEDIATDIVTINDELYISGRSDGVGNGGNDILVCKLDEFGNIIWTRSFGTVNNEYGQSISYDTNWNKLLITGYGQVNSGDNEFYALTIGLDGNAPACNQNIPNLTVSNCPATVQNVAYTQGNLPTINDDIFESIPSHLMVCICDTAIINDSIIGPTQLCQGTTATYSIHPLDTLSGYSWITTGDLNIISFPSDTAVVIDPGVNGGTLQCYILFACDTIFIDTITVNVTPPVNAGLDGADQVCNSAGSFVDINTLLSGADPGGFWTEITSSGTFDTTTAVFNTDNLTAGNYDFTYTVLGNPPCGNDTAYFSIMVVQQTASAGADSATEVCNYTGSSVDMNDLLSGAGTGGIWQELTSSGAFDSINGVFNISQLQPGTYDFEYIMNGIAPCPSDIASFQVDVNEVPVINPIVDVDLCDGDVHTSPNFSSTIASAQFSWNVSNNADIGFGLSGQGNIGPFTAQNGSLNDSTAIIWVTAVTNEGCVSDSLGFDITVHPLPVVSFNADVLSGCAPHQVMFYNNSIGSDNCIWAFGDGSVSNNCDSAAVWYETADDYDVSLIATSSWGCIAQQTYVDYINVYPVPVAAFQQSPYGTITFVDTEVDFTNNSIGADTYVWNFGDGSAFSYEENPTHIFPQEEGASYEVTLYTENIYGCLDSTHKIIEIEEILIFYIPNAFTPDGDAHNNVFKPVVTSGVDIYNFHFTIYNRWNEVVFESYSPEGGWNGAYGSGDLAQDGVYVWTLEFGDTETGEKHEYGGHVVLLK